MGDICNPEQARGVQDRVGSPTGISNRRCQVAAHKQDETVDKELQETAPAERNKLY